VKYLSVAEELEVEMRRGDGGFGFFLFADDHFVLLPMGWSTL
jgi:hypothetical protein